MTRALDEVLPHDPQQFRHLAFQRGDPSFERGQPIRLFHDVAPSGLLGLTSQAESVAPASLGPPPPFLCRSPSHLTSQRRKRNCPRLFHSIYRLSTVSHHGACTR